MNRIRALIALALAVLAATALAACGGDDDGGGDEDPQQVLDATFNNEQDVDSGVFDVSFDVTAEGGSRPGHRQGHLRRSVPGRGGRLPPVRRRRRGGPRQRVAGLRRRGGPDRHGRQGLRQLPGQRLRDPRRTSSASSRAPSRSSSSRTRSRADPARSGSTRATGSPISSNEGDRGRRGHGDDSHLGQGRRSEARRGAAAPWSRTRPQAGQVTPQQFSQLDQLNDVIETADFDIYTGADDDILRRLDAKLRAQADPRGGEPGIR